MAKEEWVFVEFLDGGYSGMTVHYLGEYEEESDEFVNAMDAWLEEYGKKHGPAPYEIQLLSLGQIQALPQAALKAVAAREAVEVWR